jgi:hypothetical protein
MHELSEWGNFYVIVGSSAGALIGLQFVVMTLVASVPSRAADELAVGAFATPTIVHLSTVLLLAAAAAAPWHTNAVAAVWGVIGGAGIVYKLIVMRRMRRQSVYRPETYDLIYYLVLPLLAYAALFVTALIAAEHTRAALFSVATEVLVLLFVGIHNAWDSVTYHVLVQQRKRAKQEAASKPATS